MKFRLVLFVLLAMIFCRQSVAQTSSALETYDRGTIYLYNTFFDSGFAKNGQMMSTGTFGSNLAAEMAGSKYALDEMVKVRRYKIIGTTTGLVATAVQIVSIVVYLLDRDYVSKPGFQIATIGIGGTAGILSMGYNRLATGAMNRAVWVYNRDVVSGRLRYEAEGMRGW